MYYLKNFLNFIHLAQKSVENIAVKLFLRLLLRCVWYFMDIFFFVVVSSTTQFIKKFYKRCTKSTNYCTLL